MLILQRWLCFRLEDYILNTICICCISGARLIFWSRIGQHTASRVRHGIVCHHLAFLSYMTATCHKITAARRPRIVWNFRFSNPSNHHASYRSGAWTATAGRNATSCVRSRTTFPRVLSYVFRAVQRHDVHKCINPTGKTNGLKRLG